MKCRVLVPVVVMEGDAAVHHTKAGSVVDVPEDQAEELATAGKLELIFEPDAESSEDVKDEDED